MVHDSKRRWRYGLALLGLTHGCLSESPVDDGRPYDDEPSAVAVSSNAITKEVPGAAEIAGRIRMNNPDQLIASYATLIRSGNCSGTMIGPNVMFTAAHCGNDLGATARFHNYNDTAPGGVGYVAEDFNCNQVANTFPETDVALYWCNPNAYGESPGDKYGYLDFDLVYNDSNQVNFTASRAAAKVGANVYSVWFNSVDNLGTNHLLFSTGAIDSISSDVWSNPTPADTSFNMNQCSQSDDLKLGFHATIYSIPGASGSSMISNKAGIAGRRILGGPISTTSLAESRDRTGQAIVEVLARTVIQQPDAQSCPVSFPAWPGPMVNGLLLQSRGLSAANFRGGVDANNNGVFDLQEQLESTEREHQRPVYWFGFDSQRSNVQWSLGNAGTIRTGSSAMYMTRDATDWLAQAQHPTANLVPGALYHMSFTAASDRQFAVCLDGCTVFNATPSGTSAYTRYSTVLPSNSSGSITIYTRGTGTSWIGEIALTQLGSVADFDSADARALWTSSWWPNTSTPSIIPLGRRHFDTVSAGDMAGVVRRGLYTLTSMALPFVAGNSRVCFDARQNPLDPTSLGFAQMRVLEGSTQRTSMQFTMPSSWQRICSPWLTMSGTSGQVDFGIQTAGSTGGGGSYLIDNVTVDTATIPSMRFAYDGPVSGMTCTRTVEDADVAGTWQDNYLCADQDLGLAWSMAGPIGGMRCTQISEAAEPPATTWGDNYLCVPQSSPLNLSWSSAGPIAGKTCVQWLEPMDPHTWADNYLCY